MRFIINPGTGPCANADLATAEENMRVFADEVTHGIAEGDGWHKGTGTLPSLHMQRAAEEDYGEGRYAFLLALTPDGPGCEVQMPGVALELLQDKDALWCPRLYVDGSSWYWGFAVGVAVDRLVGEDEA